MANPKIEYDIDEIDEIIDLHKKELKKKGLSMKLKPKSVSDFNTYLVENNIKRKNGDDFNHYKYHFWAGKQPTTGEFNYGKKVIMKKNEEMVEGIVGESKDADVVDIVTIIQKNYKNVSKLTSLIVQHFNKIKKTNKSLLDNNLKLEEENKRLKERYKKLEDGITTIMFNSQNPNNSLNDMLTFQKSQDKFISDELNMMFEDGNTRFEKLSNLSVEALSPNSSNEVNNLQNIISLQSRKKVQERISSLEDEGF